MRRPPAVRRRGGIIEVDGRPYADCRNTATHDDDVAFDQGVDTQAAFRRGFEEGRERDRDPFDPEADE
jgi:hypothetical protein